MLARISPAVAVLALLASTATAHMKMHSPVPYGSDTLTNAPLDNSGSDFPCKQRPGVYDVTEMNNMEVGVPQVLSFMGGATHGGGSCQVSVTLDQNPTNGSQWKVVHSIIGGCPSSVDNNLSDNPNDLGSSKFKFSLPDGMPNGQYTLAMTWFNKIGNREMYMNCAPITVTGGADNNDVFNSLPDMFVANIPREKCTTTEGQNFDFPNPGASVERAATGPFGSMLTGDGCEAMARLGAGAGSPAPAPNAPPKSDDAPAGPPSEKPGGIFAPVEKPSGDNSTSPDNDAPDNDAPDAPSLEGPEAPSNEAPETPSEEAPKAPSYDYSGSDSDSNSGSGSGSDSGNSSAPNINPGAGTGQCSDGSTPCSTPGSVVCIGSSQWGLCDINGCAVPRALSEGTKCENGNVAKKREIRFPPHARLHRRHAHALLRSAQM